MTSPFTKARLQRVAVVGLSLAVAGSLAACGSSTGKKQGAQSVTPGTVLLSVWPLTGQPLNGNEPKHPVMVVKVPNTSDATPQEGLAQADMISEELVEGGITRLEVFFDSKIPALVGPVRSMRASDVGMVEPMQGMLVASGAAPETINILNRDRLPFLQEDESRGYFRANYPRIAPYNLMDDLATTAKFYQVGKPYPAVPYRKTVERSSVPFFNFGASNTQLTGPKATSVSVTFSGFRTSDFAYRGGYYINTNDYTSGNPFKADNLLVIRVREGNAGYLDPAGNPVPVSILTGTGQMILFHNGVAVKGTWTKTSNKATFAFKTASGATLKIPAGRTYVELCPVNSSASEFDNGSVSYN